MQALRIFISARQAGRLLAVGIAYMLAIQALMASVGLGMSAFAAPGQDGFVICSRVSAQQKDHGGDHQKPSPPQCPFCFVAAQSAGQVGLAGAAPALPAYAGSLAIAASDSIGEGIFIPQIRRTAGAPRAPPSFSV